MEDCPTDEVLVGLFDGRLPEAEITALHEHVAECPCCFAALAEIAGGSAAEPLSEGLASRLTSDGEDVLTDESTWSPPPRFDEFRLMRELGRGRMGVVFLARDDVLKRDAALKFIASNAPDPPALARFAREAQSIAGLLHPNVVILFRSGQVDGHPFLAYEFIQGQDLMALAKPLQWERALNLGWQLACGLSAAHRNHVLHRDIKPANVMMRDGLPEVVKLVDFGLAQIADPTLGTAPQAADAAAGTPLYMAPEVHQRQPATYRSDVYSLGALLYELCAGFLPWAEEWRGMIRRGERVRFRKTVLLRFASWRPRWIPPLARWSTPASRRTPRGDRPTARRCGPRSRAWARSARSCNCHREIPIAASSHSGRSTEPCFAVAATTKAPSSID